MCSLWLNSFEAFLADMGVAPAGTSLDRIDSNKGYEPENCRWADGYTQAVNTRRTKWIEAGGRRVPMKAFARMHGVAPSALRKRMARGEDPVAAIAAIRALGRTA